MDELVDRVVNAIHGIEDLTEQVAEAIEQGICQDAWASASQMEMVHSMWMGM